MSVEDTLAERGARYGDFTDHAEICQALMRVMQRAKNRNSWPDLSDVQRQSLTVIADKIARILSGDPDYADNWHDIQGYAKLVEDRLPAAPMTFHERVAEIDMSVQRAVEVCLARGAGLPADMGATCPECGYPTDAAGTHYATCSQLTAPEEYKAEAQVAFDEAAEISEALARKVSGGTAGHTIRPPKEVLAEVSDAWRRACTEEPAAAMDDDSPRMQAIGQNGNDGEHYDDPFADAPNWVEYAAQDSDGRWYWYEFSPEVSEFRGLWRRSTGIAKVARKDEPNPNWRDTLITRT